MSGTKGWPLLVLSSRREVHKQGKGVLPMIGEVVRWRERVSEGIFLLTGNNTM